MNQPSSPSSEKWYYEQSGQQAGPVSKADLTAMLQNGRLTSTGLVWRDGLVKWTPASQLQELQSRSAEPSRPAGPQTLQAQPARSQQDIAYYGAAGSHVEVPVTAAAMQSLLKARPWAIFIAVLTFIVGGFYGIAAAVMTAAGLIIGLTSGDDEAYLLIPAGLLLLLISWLIVVIGIRLLNFTGEVKRLSTYRSPQHMELAAEALRKFFRNVGMFVIIVIVSYLATIALMVAIETLI